jgi:hypothetical protein
MQFSPESHIGHGPTAEAVVEMGDTESHFAVGIGDKEARYAVARVLEEVRTHADKIGFDDPLLMPEQEPDSIIEEIEGKLLDKDTKEVVLRGDLGKAVLSAVEAAAESEELDCQVTAIRLISKFEANEADQETEADEVLGSTELMERRRAKTQKQMEMRERLEARRKANAHRLTNVMDQEEISPTMPEPIWVDQEGKPLAKGEYLRLNNPEEMLVTYRAVKLLQDARHGERHETTLDQMIDDGEVVADLKGEEAQVARGALRLMAHGFLKEGNTDPFSHQKMSAEHIAGDRKLAKRMLDIRAQGPKTIEYVSVDSKEPVRVMDRAVVAAKRDLKVVAEPNTIDQDTQEMPIKRAA